MTYISWSSNLALYFEGYSYCGLMSQCDASFDLKINVGQSDLYFMV